jgi:glycosyltransferase involved in cell wall biosynthesis
MNNSPCREDLKFKNTTISVVIAAFNGEKFILKLLESISIQTHQVDEIIVCDDCSADNTIKVLHGFKLKYPHLNVRIINNRSRLGVTKNFSKAIKLSKCELIFLADQDDIWHQNKVQVMFDAYSNGNCSYLISDMNILNLNEGLEKFTWAELMKNNYGIGKNDLMNGCAVVATKKFFRSCLPVPYGKAHDVWFAYCAKRLKTRAFLEAPLMSYRVGPQGMTSFNFVDNLKLNERNVELSPNSNFKTLMKQEKKILLIIIKLFMHLHFIFVVIRFRSFKRSNVTIGKQNHGR